MGFLHRGTSIPTLIVKKGGRSYELKYLTLNGERISDSMEGKEYAVSSKPVEISQGRKSGYGYLCHEGKGCTMDAVEDATVLSLKTTATLVSNVMDSDLFAMAWQLKPGLRMVLAAFVIGVGLGFIGGLIL
ncbi:MAG: hypothetical protein WC683_15700 [bacterium]